MPADLDPQAEPRAPRGVQFWAMAVAGGIAALLIAVFVVSFVVGQLS